MNTRRVPVEMFAIFITLAIIGVVMVSPAFSSGCNDRESCTVETVDETYPADPQDSFFLLNPLPASANDCPSSFEERVILLINVERANAGLTPLTLDIRLQAAARFMSNDMAAVCLANPLCNIPIDHKSSDGREFWKRILDEGYDYTYAGENIAGGFTTPDSIVAGWMISQGHRDNILSENIEHLGVGYTYLDTLSVYDHFWTVDFAATDNPRDPPFTSCDPGFYQMPFPIVKK